MVILSSPSGAGKTTLVNLLSKQKTLKYQCQPLENLGKTEVPDKDYFFVDEEEFRRLIKIEFLEYAKVFNNFMAQLEHL